ncbi:MAG: hypothetical protein V4671_05620 [Armatimonadota bacterium]
MININVTLGKPQTLLAAGSAHGLGLAYFPDMPLIALKTVPFLRLIVVAGVSSYILEGSDLHHLSHPRKVLSPGNPGSYDNGYAGLAGVIPDSKGKKGNLYALYHAEDHEGMPPIPGGIPGFYASVAAASSTDEGRSWHKIGPVITSVRPKAWTAFNGQADRGVGEPCLTVDRTEKFLYAYYTDHSRIAGRGVQICLARAPLPVRARGWRKYYNGQFSEPGLGGRDTPVMSVRHLNDSDALMPSVHYSKALHCYVMLFNVNCWKEHRDSAEPKLSGVYVSYSEDATVWQEPQRLLADNATAWIGHSVTWHPSIVWDPGSTQSGWLVYGYSERWGHRSGNSDTSGIPHYLVGQRIAFRRQEHA